MTPEEFLSNLGLLTETPSGVTKLRAMILATAMRGRLVPQVPNDEPACVLAARVAAHRGRLPTEQSPLGEGPFQLPKGWIWLRLKDLADWAVGSGFPESAQGHKNKPIMFCKVSDMSSPSNRLWIESTENTVDELLAESIKAKIHPPGTVIFPKIGGAIATNKRRILRHRSAIDNNCLGLIPNGHCSSLFLYQILRSIDFTKYQAGTSIPALSQGVLGNIVIGLPPLKEQNRIVAKIDQLMGRCDELEARQAKEREIGTRFAQSSLNALSSAAGPGEFAKAWQRVSGNFEVLFPTADSIEKIRKTILELAMRGRLLPQLPHEEPTNVLLQKIAAAKAARAQKGRKSSLQYEEELLAEPPFAIPQTWQWVRLDQLLHRVEYGTSAKPIDDSSGIALLRMNNIQGGQVVFNPLRYVPRTTEDIDELMLEPGDILFNRTNSYELVGKTAVYLGQPGTYTFASYLIRVSVLTGLDSARFLNLYFRTPTFRATQLEPGIVQQNGQANFNGTKLRSVWVPVPPLAEQKRVVAKVDQIIALCDALESKLRDAEQGAQLLAEAMTAEMVA